MIAATAMWVAVLLGLVAVGLGLLLWRERSRADEREEEVARLRRELGDIEEAREEVEEAFARLRSQQAELVNSARMATLGSLIAGIAHELDTPLGALNSNHDTLRRSLAHLQEILADERVDDSELDEVRRIVRAVDGVMETNELAVERLIDLVGSLRGFARPDRADRGKVDLHGALEDTLSLLQHEMGGGVRVEREFGDLPPVECFPGQLNQVFMNLLLNACHAIEEDGGEGIIEIRTVTEDDRVRVEIADTGCGIPPDHLERIFEPGFTTKGSRMGMGLGLLITRQVVERHEGEIEVESEPGVGTRFTLRLPLRLTASS